MKDYFKWRQEKNFDRIMKIDFKQTGLLNVMKRGKYYCDKEGRPIVI